MKNLPFFFFMLTSTFAYCQKTDNRTSASIQAPVHEQYLHYAACIDSALQNHHRAGDHLFKRACWWNAANIMEAMIDYSRISATDCSKMCRGIYRANCHKMLGSFRNRAFDDSGWWALAWLKAYDRSPQPGYLRTAEKIFTYMQKQGWDENCGGGMNWMRNAHYKNAVTNQLFILLAARMATHQSNPEHKNYYVNQSIKAYRWLAQSGMLNEQHLYNDGLDHCKNNRGNTWTYNQGIILAAEKELYLLTGDTAYLQSARKTAYACMKFVADTNGILTDKLGKDAGPDGPQFKGVFMRQLAELNSVLHDKGIHDFVQHNAEVAFKNAQNKEHLFDFTWQGPFHDWSGAATGSALDLMNAAVREGDTLH